MTNTSVLSVSNEILKQADEKGILLRPLKLMKLTYMAHAVKLSVVNDGIFLESVEAWKYGPVIDALYQKTKQFGNKKIPVDALNSYSNDKLSEVDRLMVEFTLNKWGGYSGPELSTATHQPETPWHKVWHNEGGQYSFGTIISNDIIQSHYQKILGL